MPSRTDDDSSNVLVARQPRVTDARLDLSALPRARVSRPPCAFLETTLKWSEIDTASAYADHSDQPEASEHLDVRE